MRRSNAYLGLALDRVTADGAAIPSQSQHYAAGNRIVYKIYRFYN